MSVVERVREAVKYFETVQKKYDSYGAWDTEPDGVFQSLLRRAFVKGECKVPYTGDKWELYTSSMDCELAGVALGDACQRVVDLIVRVPGSERAELKAFLKGYCWRCGGLD